MRTNPTPSHGPRQTRIRAISLVLLAAFSAVLLGACSASGEGILSTGDRNAFTELGNKFSTSSGTILTEINAADTKGDFTGVKAKTDPLFADLDGTISQMQSQAQKLKGNPQAIGDQMTTTAQQWSAAAKSAVTAGANKDEATYKANVAQMNALADTFNNLIQQWNQIQAK